MRPVVRKIDQALKRLYRIDATHRAEDYLIKKPVDATTGVGNAELQGALFVRPGGAKSLRLGIYLSEGVRRRLVSFRRWPDAVWTRDQLDAFTVAVEEVSHFNYLLFHAAAGRPVSQLELEVQGEVDKFLVTFFSVLAGRAYDRTTFDVLIEQLFYRFRLAESLSPEQRERYEAANALARRFVLKWRAEMDEGKGREAAFRLLRRFYRLGPAERMSFLAG